MTYNQVTDVQILHDKGKLLPADWQSRLPNNSSPFYSTMGFPVRKEPENIHDWSDLVRSDVKLIFLTENLRQRPLHVSGGMGRSG